MVGVTGLEPVASFLSGMCSNQLSYTPILKELDANNIKLLMEATSGFEPLHSGFADRCLTTWLRRRLAIC